MDIALNLQQQIYLSGNITLAIILSSIIGLNRERSNKSAGLRTHMLTGAGACIFTILSLYAFPNADSSRIASNVVTGIGFLGGGIIIQRKHEAHDLTTAVGIWATASIGMAVGAGAWFIAIYSTVILWVILSVMKVIKEMTNDSQPDIEQAT